MIVKPTDSICVCCGEQIPEGRQVCPSCGASEGDFFQKMSRIIPTVEKEFEVDDVSEQAFRSGYNKGFADGMKAACGLKQENERLKRENAMLRSAAESRARCDDMDGEYE